MQKVAMEMNLSETAFLVKQADGFDLRWFTPSVEVDLCGHATLASAHALWETGHLQRRSAGAVPHQQRRVDGGPERRVDRIEFSGDARGGHRSVSATRGSAWREPKYVGKNNFDYLVEVEETALRG